MKVGELVKILLEVDQNKKVDILAYDKSIEDEDYHTYEIEHLDISSIGEYVDKVVISTI